MKLISMCVILLCSIYTQEKIDVWIDADPAAGIQYRDVDDAVALLQAFRSPELNIVGISVVFGNTSLEKGYPIAQFIVKEFSKNKIPVYKGASENDPVGLETEASKKMLEALKEKPLTILALGPVTNVATVVNNHPEITKQIKEIIAVAGRRPGARFQTGTKNNKAHRDFNFERDSKSFAQLLESNVPIVLAPFEISSQVWITKSDLDLLENQGDDACKWLVPHAKGWLNLWKVVFDVEGFNPFDTLAIAYLTSPKFITYENLPVEIQILEDDVTEERMQGTKSKEKPYLLVAKDLKTKRYVTYCYKVSKEFKQNLLNRLIK
ncbi:nucleoside hydrolase [Candidatus Uabimicrobium sp. HlEnr_7]|uniref:nucleoside hydrolase n=1 Tax=Candidatus Uabimicrobium helgolandensis TaxID=3095367 RepID=UPI003557F22C